jgi:rhodanese-related sulfurtransferase
VNSAVDTLLDRARQRLHRLEPRAAAAAVAAGAVLVDIRPQQFRASEGSIPGTLIVERNVLEWRLDPTCPDHLPIAAPDLHVIVVCNEGYAASLAAAALQDLGLSRATDLIGGYRAWRAAGLPVDRAI